MCHVQHSTRRCCIPLGELIEKHPNVCNLRQNTIFCSSFNRFMPCFQFQLTPSAEELPTRHLPCIILSKWIRTIGGDLLRNTEHRWEIRWKFHHIDGVGFPSPPPGCAREHGKRAVSFILFYCDRALTVSRVATAITRTHRQRGTCETRPPVKEHGEQKQEEGEEEKKTHTTTAIPKA